ncbi:MAG: cyclic peptide export ABC transporter [Balneolales bacterium]|nr:cyclic peptide export ABC transporter [Balneolales bacterium]
MNFLELVKVESEKVTNKILIYAGISGVANASILAIINGAAGSVEYGDLNTQYLILFVIALSLNIYTQRYLFDFSSDIIERIVHKIRIRLTEKIRKAELVDIDEIGKAQIYNRMTQQTTEISQSSGAIIAALQSAIMVTFAIFYLASLSIYAFVLTIVIVVIGLGIYLNKEKFIVQFIHLTNKSEVRLFRALSNLLDGFKEVKLNKDRSDDLATHINGIALEVKESRIKTDQLYNWNYIFAQSFFYVLVAVMVFVLPKFVEHNAENVTEIAAVILFIIGPLSTVVSGFPAYTRADIAVKDVHDLEKKLDKLNGRPDDYDPALSKNMTSFDKIRMEQVSFSYYDTFKDSLFNIGPISLEIQRGETLFIVGGNGSGKSTLLKLLTGLYRPESGRIRVGNNTVKQESTQEYRQLFSAIFSDFHLFDRLYGIRKWEQERVDELIAQMGLSDKTSFKNGEFTNLNLSTGQRKRIAMIISLLENRPVCIFDEWAADQDPEFRKYFYYELIPSLKQAGKTLIIVSHDDQYFNTADRIIKLEYGNVVPFES